MTTTAKHARLFWPLSVNGASKLGKSLPCETQNQSGIYLQRYAALMINRVEYIACHPSVGQLHECSTLQAAHIPKQFEIKNALENKQTQEMFS